MNNIVDSHCHLDFPDFKDDLNDVILRANEKKIKYFLSISVNLEDFKNIKRISDKYENIWCTTGIHPNNVPLKTNEKEFNSIYDEICKNLKNNKVVGLGETGLDFYRNKENLKNQTNFFDLHMKLSGERNIPTIIHSRNADRETKLMIKKATKNYGSKGLIHCFSSTKGLAEVALDNGFYISISGIITFKKADELREIIKYIPLNKLLIETDAPYLAPVPKRGKRNEPSFLEYTLKEISIIKNLKPDEIAEKTTSNFFQLFDKIKK